MVLRILSVTRSMTSTSIMHYKHAYEALLTAYSTIIVIRTQIFKMIYNNNRNTYVAVIMTYKVKYHNTNYNV